MSPVSRALLPGAVMGRAAAANPARRGPDRAWQREMEKAQAHDWFHGAVSQQGAASGSSAMPRAGVPGAEAGSHRESVANRPPQEQGSAPLPVRSTSVEDRMHFTVQDRLGQDMQSGQSVAAASPESRPAAPPALHAAPSASDLVGRMARDASSKRDPGAQAGPEATDDVRTAVDGDTSLASEVRVHVEESADGLRIWLGLGAKGALLQAQAEALLASLHREVESSGETLAAVVCNGRTIFTLDIPRPAVVREPAHVSFPSSHQEPPCP